MTKGIDSNTVLINRAGCLAKAGIQFAGRYYKYSDTCLKRDEAEALSRAGIWIVSIWELGLPTQARYFNRASGEAAGLHSAGLAQDAGQPAGTAIYYTVDYDAALSDLVQVEEYFRGIRQAKHDYMVGVYGSGLVCERIRAVGLAEKTWLAAPLGWRGSEYSWWDIRQTAVERSLCGVMVDLDESWGDGGGWRIDTS